jgi:hypothetical protein
LRCIEEMLGEPRKLGVDLEMHAGRHEGEALEEALDVGIGALERLQAEPPGDTRELTRELRA